MSARMLYCKSNKIKITQVHWRGVTEICRAGDNMSGAAQICHPCHCSGGCVLELQTNIREVVFMEKAPTMAISWLTAAFTRHYAKQALTYVK